MSAADHPTPSTPSVDVPLSVGLLSRNSLMGGAVVLLGALFFLIGLPWLATVLDANPFEAGQPYTVAESYQITPAPGWSINSESELFTTIGKSNAQLILTPAVDSEQTPQESIDLTITALENDATSSWVISEPQTFVTNNGDHGLKLIAHSETLASETWVITSGDQQITIIAQVPDAIWPNLTEELEEMVATVSPLQAGESP